MWDAIGCLSVSDFLYSYKPLIIWYYSWQILKRIRGSSTCYKTAKSNFLFFYSSWFSSHNNLVVRTKLILRRKSPNNVKSLINEYMNPNEYRPSENELSIMPWVHESFKSCFNNFLMSLLFNGRERLRSLIHRTSHLMLG